MVGGTLLTVQSTSVTSPTPADPTPTSAATAEIVVVEDPGTAVLLADRDLVRFLAPFLDREVTITQAAAELGMTVRAAFPRVRRLQRLGLVHITREEPRAGRAIKHYTAAGQEFFVPLGALPPGPEMFASESYWHRQFLLNLHRELLGAFEAAPEPGVRIYRDTELGVLITAAHRPGGSLPWPQQETPTAFAWRSVLLSEEQATDLKHLLLDAVLALPAGPPAEGPVAPAGRRRYVVGVHLVHQSEDA